MFKTPLMGTRVSHSAAGMQYLYNILHGAEPDLRLLRVIRARTFLHIKTHAEKVKLKAVEGCLFIVGNSKSSKSYRASNPANLPHHVK